MTYRAAVVLLAGGMGNRMQADVNKVYLPIKQRGMIDYSFETAIGCPVVSHVVLVIRPMDTGFVEHLEQPAAHGPEIRRTFGGDTRHASEHAGVAALRAEIDAGAIDIVAVHDGARPFMSPDLLRRVLDEAAESGGAIAACPVEDTLFALDRRTFVDSAEYMWAQTPQAFDAAVLLAAHDAADEAGFTGVDTAEVVERFSDQPIKVVLGEAANIKVTYQHDLKAAEATANGPVDGSPSAGADITPPA